jgi:predicted transcriptional regulator
MSDITMIADHQVGGPDTTPWFRSETWCGRAWQMMLVVIRDKQISKAALPVLTSLMHGQQDPSEIAKKYHLSHDLAKRCIQQLEQRGYIKRRTKRAGYQIIWSKANGIRKEFEREIAN